MRLLSKDAGNVKTSFIGGRKTSVFGVSNDRAILRVNEGLAIDIRPDEIQPRSDTKFGPTALGIDEIKAVLMVGYESRKDNVLIIHTVVEELCTWSKELETNV